MGDPWTGALLPPCLPPSPGLLHGLPPLAGHQPPPLIRSAALPMTRSSEARNQGSPHPPLTPVNSLHRFPNYQVTRRLFLFFFLFCLLPWRQQSQLGGSLCAQGEPAVQLWVPSLQYFSGEAEQGSLGSAFLLCRRNWKQLLRVSRGRPRGLDPIMEAIFVVVVVQASPFLLQATVHY